MRSLLKSLANDILAFGDSYLTPLTNKDDIQALFHKLFPLSTDKNLIRLGPKGDGGYLIPDDLDGIEACFSPGVSLISGFEKDCADLGMRVFMADKSVERPAESHDLFYFNKKFVGAMTNDDFMTIDDWVEESFPGSDSDLMLQMDIEGYEYETFLRISDRLMRRFRMIIVEFHDLDKLWSSPFFRFASRTFEKILLTHKCVHIHPNNCRQPINKGGIFIPPLLEFTFLRNDRVHNPSWSTVFPHPLDCDNSENTHFSLPSCLYYSS